MQIIGQGAFERPLEEDAALLEPVLIHVRNCLARQGLAEDLGQTQRLGQLQRQLEPRGSLLGLVAEHEEPSELRGGVREVLVRLFVRERCERRLESGNRLGRCPSR